MNKKLLFSVVLLLSMPAFGGKVLSFVTGSFKGFVNRAIPASERESFADYYGKINAQIKSKKQPEQVELNYALRKKALDALKKQHRSWANDINAFITNPYYLDAAYDSERTKLRNFLSWYGAYEKFQETTDFSQTNTSNKYAHFSRKNEESFSSAKLIHSVKTQVAKAKEVVGGWFNKLKTRLT